MCRALVVSIVFVSLASFVVPAPGWSPADSSRSAASAVIADGVTAAREFVATAFQAELEGDQQGRSLYLREAIEQDPANAEAHWQLGEVYLAGRWLPAEEACALAAQARARAEYRQRRSLMDTLPERQFDLALWCKSRGLIDEGRAHLFNAWQDRPELMDQSDTLGLTLYEGVWLTPEQLRKEKESRKSQRIAASQWKPRLIALRRKLGSSKTEVLAEARAEMSQICDPGAVPAIEEVFSANDARQSLYAVQLLDRIAGQAAATSLVRHAVFSRWPEIRKAAAESLRSRSLYSYAPLLLAALQAPVEARLDDISQDGASLFRLSLTREGPMADFELTEFLTATPVGARTGSVPLTPTEAARARAAVAREVARVTTEVSQMNAGINELNERIGSALATAADVAPSEKPRQYWQWWYDYNDIYYPPQRPVQQVAYQRPTLFYRVSECFAAGTPVWTAAGPVPIEQIQVGDCVLSQDVETGELAFKPVVSTSTRPPSPLLKVGIDQETITVTRGHPMWVVGRGWRMAKELSIGDLVRTIAGPATIESIEPAPEQAAYNLVVAEFNTYFAGKSKLLVHDNTLRRHTDNVLPGLPQNP
jgi:hypothetical protein